MDVFPLRFLGVISYSVYLTHMIFFAGYLAFPFFVDNGKRTVRSSCSNRYVAEMVFALSFLAGVLFWSFVSYMFVERPGIMLGRFLLKEKKCHPPSPIRLKVEESREPVAV